MASRHTSYYWENLRIRGGEGQVVPQDVVEEWSHRAFVRAQWLHEHDPVSAETARAMRLDLALENLVYLMEVADES